MFTGERKRLYNRKYYAERSEELIERNYENKLKFKRRMLDNPEEVTEEQATHELLVAIKKAKRLGFDIEDVF